jgi:type I restriction enzyme M protein
LPIKELRQIKIPLPSLEEQEKIVEELEKEQELVDANKQLIKIFENKIKNVIQRIWD